ncbi:MAG: ATP-binding cassette domain-containing protein [Candidatus Cloacimonetes bacterium]|nr:ATP-binding cassette domain-containing protein [Candidatus Cloacimonadota bacterium]
MRNLEIKEAQDRQKVTIDMVTKLYVYSMNSGEQISSAEISVLYSLLTNLFAHVDVSWEAYVRDITASDYQIDEVLEYLNRYLSQLDKVRILQSLVIIAKTEGELSISTITELLDFCKKLSLSPDGFVNLIDYFEAGSSGDISISCEHSIAHVKHSLFSDYIVFGSSVSADIRYRNDDLAAYEMSLYAIDKYIFIGMGANTSLQLNNKPISPNNIVLLHPESKISIGGIEYSNRCLKKIYEHRDANDEIVFYKSNYDFIVNKRGLWYSLNIRSGSVTLNRKVMLHNKRYEIYYDDIIQIRNYAPWNLTDLIENRSSIGLDDMIPQALYINHERNYFDMSRVDSDKKITKIELIEGVFFVQPPKSGWTIYLNQKKIEESSPITLNSDIITIDKRNFRINDFYDLIETPFELQSLCLADVKHYFPDGQLALDGISSEAKKGQLIGILGQSGCGKSTLVKVLSGEIVPTYGQLLVDGKDFFLDASYYLQFFGYVPQDDLLYPYLTVYENLWYRLRLRMPNISKASLDQKINNILHQVNLTHQSDTKVGEFKKKNLSGGERKRLNIALELLFEPTVIICDEPTSGLSFTDAEQIIDILSSLTKQGKIVMITIHQPNSSIFRKFDQVMLMDMGGRMAYTGSPTDCFSYFDEELASLTVRTNEIERKKQLMTSDFMYDVITYPEYNEFNEPVYEQINKYIQPKRKFSPEYWRDKFKRKMLYAMIHHDTGKINNSAIPLKGNRTQQSLPSRLVQIYGYIIRSFKMKLRNRTNNLITFVQAPLLGLVVAFILRYTPLSPPYNYAENNNIGIFVFVSVIAFIFLGISNSIEEITDERKIIIREKQMNLKISYYQVSKLITLSLFVLIQAVLYQSVASSVLGIRGLFGISVIYLFLSGLTGISIGLTCSSFIKEKKAIINLLPLILIPQIIFGGAVIEFERMNRSLTIYKQHPIPEIVQTIPSRWLFEGMTTAYAKNTVFHRAMAKLEKKKLTQMRSFRDAEISSSSYDKMKTKLYYEKVRITERWNPDELMNNNLNAAVSLMDGKVLSQHKNMFLSSFKTVGNTLMRTWNFNIAVLLVYFMLFNGITAVKLKYYFKE